MKEILSTHLRWEGTLLRLLLGIVIFAHGAQKLLGWYGGFGFAGTMDFFTGTVGLPWLVGLLIILLESVGALLIIAGLLTRVWASLLVVLFIGIIASSHLQYGFFMNWFGQQQGEGYEFHLLVIAMSLALALGGSGRLSTDYWLLKKIGA